MLLLVEALSLNETIEQDIRDGWQASLNLTFVDRADKTVLKNRQQSGPLAATSVFDVKRAVHLLTSSPRRSGRWWHTSLKRPSKAVHMRWSLHPVRPSFTAQTTSTLSRSKRFEWRKVRSAWSGCRKRTSFFPKCTRSFRHWNSPLEKGAQFGVGRCIMFWTPCTEWGIWAWSPRWENRNLSW